MVWKRVTCTGKPSLGFSAKFHLVTPDASRATTPVEDIETFDPSCPSLSPSDSILLPMSKIPDYLDMALNALTLRIGARTSFITVLAANSTQARIRRLACHRASILRKGRSDAHLARARRRQPCLHALPRSPLGTMWAFGPRRPLAPLRRMARRSGRRSSASMRRVRLIARCSAYWSGVGSCVSRRLAVSGWRFGLVSFFFHLVLVMVDALDNKLALFGISNLFSFFFLQYN